MKVLLNEQGYVVSYALEGELLDAVETAEPADLSHFEEHFTAYRVQDGTMAVSYTHLLRHGPHERQGQRGRISQAAARR